MRAWSAWDRCGVLLHTHQIGDSLTVAEAALTELQKLMKAPIPQVFSLRGALYLRCAVASARRRDAASAWGHLAEAESAAARISVDRNDFQTVFGPTNGDIHAAEIAVALYRSDIALRRQDRIDLDRLPSKKRQTCHRVEIARA